MTPPVFSSRIVSIAFLVTSIRPKKLISICWRICFSDKVSNGPLSPYLISELRVREVLMKMSGHLPRVVDDNVDALELLYRCIESFVNRVFLGDIKIDKQTV
jgi:hypothetical protein